MGNIAEVSHREIRVIGIGIIHWLWADVPSRDGGGATAACIAIRCGCDCERMGCQRNFPFREPDPIAFNDHAGYTQIFDGVSLKGWDGDPSIWHVEDGAIVGKHPKDKPLGNTYIAYRGFEAKDFDLRLEIKVEQGGGSGIQYRSKTGLPWKSRTTPR